MPIESGNGNGHQPLKESQPDLVLVVGIGAPLNDEPVHISKSEAALAVMSGLLLGYGISEPDLAGVVLFTIAVGTSVVGGLTVRERIHDERMLRTLKDIKETLEEGNFPVSPNLNSDN